MTPEDIVRLAEQAGFEQHEAFSGILVRYSVGEWINIEDELNIFANLVAAAAREAGIQEGMKREHAMWVLAKIGQEIEHVHDVDTSSEHVHKAEENEHEYCDHGIRHNRHCKSCECIEQAEMRSEME